MPAKFLVLFQYHEPEPFQLFARGTIEDYESITGVYIEATTAEEAQEWAEFIAGELLRHCNADVTLDWTHFDYSCWVETRPEESPWSHCLEFFQHVEVGELPDLERMDTAAYQSWLEKHGVGSLDCRDCVR